MPVPISFRPGPQTVAEAGRPGLLPDSVVDAVLERGDKAANECSRRRLVGVSGRGIIPLGRPSYVRELPANDRSFRLLRLPCAGFHHRRRLFGTPRQRFTRHQPEALMKSAGYKAVAFLTQGDYGVALCLNIRESGAIPPGAHPSPARRALIRCSGAYRLTLSVPETIDFGTRH